MDSSTGQPRRHSLVEHFRFREKTGTHTHTHSKTLGASSLTRFPFYRVVLTPVGDRIDFLLPFVRASQAQLAAVRLNSNLIWTPARPVRVGA